MPPGKHYSKTEREQGFAAIVLADENCARAERDLAAAGIKIPRDTLAYWRRNHPEELEKVRTTLAPQMEAKKMAMADRVATAAGEATLELIERTMAQVDNLSPRDLPGAARNLAVVYGLGTDKGQLHRDKPTVITRHTANFDQNIKRLERMGLIEGTAEEVKDVELVEKT